MDRTTVTTWAPFVVMALVALWWVFRAVRRTPSLWRTKLAAGFVVLVVVVTCLTWGSWSTYVRTRNWTTTEATIQNVETEMVSSPGVRVHRRSVTTHERTVATQTLDVSYTAAGREETWTGRFDEWHHTGETIQIKYDPDDPQSIVEVIATSDKVTPVGATTSSTVSSVAGMPTFALVAMGAWIVAVPFFAVLAATWLVSRRRRAGWPERGDGAQPNPSASPPAWQPTRGPSSSPRDVLSPQTLASYPPPQPFPYRSE